MWLPPLPLVFRVPACPADRVQALTSDRPDATSARLPLPPPSGPENPSRSYRATPLTVGVSPSVTVSPRYEGGSPAALGRNPKMVFADNSARPPAGRGGVSNGVTCSPYGVRAMPCPRVRRPFRSATSGRSPSSRRPAGLIRSTGRSRRAVSVVGVLLVALGPVPRGRRRVLTGGASHARVGYVATGPQVTSWGALRVAS